MKDKPECRTAVLCLKLGACQTAPTKRMAADLHEAALQANHAWAAMADHWLRRAKEHFGTVQTVHCKGLPKGRLVKNKKTGEIKQSRPTPARDFTILVMPEKISQLLPAFLLSKEISAELYHAGKAAAPTLASGILAAMSNTLVSSFFCKRTPWNHRGKAKRMWQAVLWHEAAAPSFRAIVISTPIASTALELGAMKGGVTLTFPLWAKESGREHLKIQCRIGTRKLPRGIYKIVKLAAEGEGGWKVCDSELVWKEDKKQHGRGTWFWHMTYKRPPINLGLSPTNIARLTLHDGKADKPFEIASAVNFPWQIGDAHVLLGAYKRLEQRRLAIRNKYKNAGSGKKGHGRGRIEYSIRPMTRAMTAIQQRFSKRVVSEVIRYCQRYDCGTVVFDRPGMKQKMSGWFAAKDAPFDWTQFIAQLEYRCWLFGIRLTASGEDMDGTPGDARVPQPDGSTGDAPTTAVKTLKSRKENSRRSRKAG